MYCNAAATLHQNGVALYFPSVYVTDKQNSDISTNGQTNKTQRILYIPQNMNPVVALNSINFKTGHDYFTFPGDEKKYTVKSVTKALYGSAHMRHVEAILE